LKSHAEEDNTINYQEIFRIDSGFCGIKGFLGGFVFVQFAGD
jgi:hypothetical protein